MLVTSHLLLAGRTLAEYAALSDGDLVGRVTLRDQTALQALMLRHHVRIARFLRRFTTDRSLVEDLVADTFFAAWQQAPRFEQRSSVATWLLAIARYKALSARERRTLPTEPLDGILTATLVDGGPRPDAAHEREDRARYLRQCLASLPAEQAQALDLVYYRDKSIKEVASLTRVSENTVKSRLFLARQKLAALLKAADADTQAVSLVPGDALPRRGEDNDTELSSETVLRARQLAPI